MAKENTGCKAEMGEKMLEIRIRLWTDQIAENKGEIIPKHALDTGIVYMTRNKSHGIESSESEKFHSLLGLPAAIERLLLKNQIRLHLGRHSKKYHATQAAQD